MLTILQKISPVLLLLAVATLLVAVFLNHTPETIFFADDGAFALSLGNIILDGDLIFSGLPSHLGGRHIGPFYLYLVAGISFLARQDPYLTIFLFSLFKVLTTGILISYLFSFFVPRKYFSLGLTFVFAAITAGDSVVNFRILWVNNLISIFVLLQLIVLFHLFQFGKRVLPAFILSSSFLIQIHLMTAPLILVTWVAGLASLRKSTTEQAKSFFTDPIVRLISTVLSLLLWLLPLIYEVFYESNFRKLFIKHFQSENSGVGILAAGKLFYKFVCHNLFGQTYYQSLQAGSPFYWKAIFLLII
ncbi:MAG: hypothetical protein R3A13_02705 [Bdellovibrionota bacterium]